MIYDLDCVHLNFSDLRNLFLGANQISEIPSEIKAFKRLKVLYLGGNSLTQLPAEICELQRLQALILAQNELKSLPNSICNLKKLETLQLHQVMLVTFSLGSVQDFMIKLDIKPLMHLLEMSTFSLNNGIVRLTKIMNRADKN